MRAERHVELEDPFQPLSPGERCSEWCGLGDRPFDGLFLVGSFDVLVVGGGPAGAGPWTPLSSVAGHPAQAPRPA
jgi:hypothetical protein